MSVFRIRYEKAGGHIHMRVFSAKAPNMTFAKLGDLCCSEEEFADFKRACSGVEFRAPDITEIFKPLPEDEAKLLRDYGP